MKEKKGEKKNEQERKKRVHWSRAPRGFRGCGGVRGDVIFRTGEKERERRGILDSHRPIDAQAVGLGGDNRNPPRGT